MTNKEAKGKATEKDKGIEITLIPSDNLMSNRLYSNYVQVNQSPFDFSLRFCDAPAIYDMDEVIKNKGAFQIPVVAEIVVPLEIMPRLIDALKKEYEKYLELSKGDIDGKKAK